MKGVLAWIAQQNGYLPTKKRIKFIATLTPNLTVLRTRAEISQEELANLIGVFRQTYCAIERKVRKMAWSTYLSLVLFYDHNQKTHKLIRRLSVFPKELIIRFNDGAIIVTMKLVPSSTRSLRKSSKI